MTTVNNKSILYGIIGLVVGVLIMMVIATNAVNTQNIGLMRMMGMGINNMGQQNKEMGMGSSMDQMMGSISDKSGFSFDKSFIDAMIVHHEGAIRMAEQAIHRAGHQEIKDLSINIIKAQTAEIEQMKQWRKDWMME